MSGIDDVAGMPLATIPGYLLRRTQRVHNSIWTDELGSEITSPQYAVLAALALYPDVDQGGLGRLTSLDKSSIADIVERLAERGWIVIRRDVKDGRRKVLALTQLAATSFEHLTPAASRVQTRLLDPLGGGVRRTTFLNELKAVARLPIAIGVENGGTLPQVLNLDAPGHLIRCAQQVHTAIWMQEFGRHLTGPQYATLHVLAQSDSLSQRQLGELAALDKSTAADLVARLVRRGLIVSRVDPSDRRSRILALGMTAGVALPKITRRVASVQARVIEPLGQESRDRFIADLSLLAFEGHPESE